ncbi:MAG TPA: alpha/beta fold hydrolase [Bacillales bacterium]|nr:alpha/beta fold hydrolase [Bacillales bacterium]
MPGETTEEGRRGGVKKYKIEQFMNTESLIGVSVSNDDQNILYASDQSGVFNAYQISPTDGNPEQLTTSATNAIFPVSYFPHDKRFLYSSDQGGNEITHLFVRNEDGKAVDLTPGEQEKAEFYQWSHDKKSFFYGSNKRDPRYMDLYEMDIETFEPSLYFQNDGGYQIAAVSPDKNHVALVKPRIDTDTDIYIYSAETGIKHLSPHEGDIRHYPTAFNSDSTYLYYLTDQESEFMFLKRIHIDSRTTETIAKENWDIVFARFSPQHQYLVYGTNDNASIKIKVMEASTGEFVELSDLPDGQISSVTISQSEKLMAFLLNSSTSPANLYVFDFEKKRLNRLTDTLNPEIDPKDLVEAKVIHYSSFDNLEIPAIYYEPHLDPGQKVPALVWVHGGPGGQSTVDYNPIFQYLANHGYAVLAVNNRGSSGYGKTFFKAADLKHGEVDLADCVEAKAFLTSTGHVDETRIGIIGGSYGGYMVLAALAFQPDAFKVGVDIFGVSNWERTLKNTPSWWAAFRDALFKKIGNPYTDPEYIRSISPLFHADNITKPLFVLQGANDPRVLKVESDEIVESVRKNGVPVEYIVFDNEGHGFTKRENRIKGYKAAHEFLDAYLK